MRFFYDTEFYENGSMILPISIGIVDENGRELYLENANFEWLMVPEDHWIQDNVRPHLMGGNYELGYLLWGPAIQKFIVEDSPKERHELWGYYSAYDHVVLAQTFGRMIDLPKGIPMFTHDLKQWASQLEYPHAFPVQEGVQHHALSDARWNRDLYNVLLDYSIPREIAWYD